MRCPLERTRDNAVLLGYCARTLPRGTAADVQLHIAGCDPCSQWIADQRKVWDALDEWEAEPPAADFDRRLYARIEEQERSQWPRRFLPGKPGWRPAMPIAAACVTVIAAALLSTPPKALLPSMQESLRVEMTEPEQVERILEDLEMLKQLSSGSGSQNL
jgi:hypothetical protein